MLSFVDVLSVRNRIIFRAVSSFLIWTACICWSFANASTLKSNGRPNVLWITSEDNGCHLGCYGDEYSDTPNLDALAKRGVRYVNCWAAAPVCAPSRTAIITGMWPHSMGAQHMRSEVSIPSAWRLLPEVMQRAGYYCTNNSKEDYNLSLGRSVWNDSSKTAHWRNRPSTDTPFFAVFNSVASHESQIRKRPHVPVHDPAFAPLPSYHPDLPEVRRDWAQYYDQLTVMDSELGNVLSQLHEDGLDDNTIVIYFGDHGSGMPRGKRWLYDSGLKVPLIVSVPERYRSEFQLSAVAGESSTQVVSLIDLFPSMMRIAGVDPKTLEQPMRGRSLFDEKPKDVGRTVTSEYAFAFRDRMDEHYDCSRAVRSSRFLYIRNFLPQYPQGQYLQYMFETPTTVAWKSMFESGRTSADQSTFWKPKHWEELYDVQSDPDNVNNLAMLSEYREQADSMREVLYSWMIETEDTGLIPESILFESQSSWADAMNDGRIRSRYPRDELSILLGVADCATRLIELPEELRVAARKLQSSESVSFDVRVSIAYWMRIGGWLRAAKGHDSLETWDQFTQQLASEDVSRSAVVERVLLERNVNGEDSAKRSEAIEKLVTRYATSMNYIERIELLDTLCRVTHFPEFDSIWTRVMSENPPANLAPPAARYGTYEDRLKLQIEGKFQ